MPGPDVSFEERRRLPGSRTSASFFDIPAQKSHGIVAWPKLRRSAAMILDLFADLNWLAVVVAPVAWFAFSAIRYSVPPISNAWQRAAKVTASDGPPLVKILIP